VAGLGKYFEGSAAGGGPAQSSHRGAGRHNRRFGQSIPRRIPGQSPDLVAFFNCGIVIDLEFRVVFLAKKRSPRFQHTLVFDRSSMTRWRQRMGEERLAALIQESLSVATKTGAAKPSDFSKVIVDTTVQPKAVAHPTDAKRMHRAREKLVALARKQAVALRQSYQRVGKYALIAYQRYAQPTNFCATTEPGERWRSPCNVVI
jgi:hypothetical protein